MTNVSLLLDEREQIVLMDILGKNYHTYAHYPRQIYDDVKSSLLFHDFTLLSSTCRHYNNNTTDRNEFYIKDGIIINVSKENNQEYPKNVGEFIDDEADIEEEETVYANWYMYTTVKEGLPEDTKIFKKLLNLPRKPNSPKDNLYLVSQTPNGQLYLKEFKITSKISIDLNLNYNEDFKEIHEIMTDKIENTNKGIILLHGKPGTGKTSYIKWLLQNTPKKVVFLPPNLADSLAMPSFIDFVSDDCKDSLIVIEDAENVLRARDSGQNSSVSNILNMTDGLLSEVFNIQILATFNSDLLDIDAALRRQGRIIVEYKFDELSKDRAQQLSNKLGFTTTIDKPMVLTKVFNQEEKEFEKVNERKKVGFV